MKITLPIIAVLLLSGCGKAKPEEKPEPLPVWVEHYQATGHWACPDGYFVEFDARDNTVSCTKNEVNPLKQYRPVIKPEVKK